MPIFSSHLFLQKVAQLKGALLEIFTTTIAAESSVDTVGQIAFDSEVQKIVCFADGELKKIKYDDKIFITGIDLVKDVKYEIEHGLNDEGVIAELWHENNRVIIPISKGKVLDGTDTANYVHLESAVDVTGVQIVLIH